MPRPTLDHVTAADGTRLTITTRVDGSGVVHVALFRDPDKSTAFARAEFIAACNCGQWKDTGPHASSCPKHERARKVQS